jgi:hypothetical protein
MPMIHQMASFELVILNAVKDLQLLLLLFPQMPVIRSECDVCNRLYADFGERLPGSSVD